MDPGTYGGAPLLGVNGFVLIAHGNSNARSIKNALVRANDAARSGMIESIRTALQHKS
jgi:glycerol-3-phosphate acyltransferase PlsX